MFDGIFINQWAIGLDVAKSSSMLNYNIAGGLGTNSDSQPNVLSELDFKDLNGTVVALSVGSMSQVNENLALSWKLSGGSSSSLSGTTRDKDYLGNNRTEMFSDSTSSSSGSSINFFSIEGQMKFRWRESVGNYWGVSLGASSYKYDIAIHTGTQLYPANGAIAGLKSSYTPEYKNISVGIFTEHQIGPTFVTARYEKIKTLYDSESNWNLRTDYEHPKSFIQNGDGYGESFTVKVTLPVTEKLDLSLTGKKMSMGVKNGYDQIFLKDGDSGATKLNSSIVKNTSISLGISYHF